MMTATYRMDHEMGQETCNNAENMILQVEQQQANDMARLAAESEHMAKLLMGTKKNLTRSLGQLGKWVTAGENELYLRQLIDATLSETQTGYSIAHFDFLIYFKHKNVREKGSEEALKYLRRLILAEYMVKVRTNTKYQNFHRRHDAMIKLWQQMVRVISFESTIVANGMHHNEEEEGMFNASDDDESPTTTESSMSKSAQIKALQRKRIQIIRGYMVHCQNTQQSKTQQCSDLKNIFSSLWNIEKEQERIEGQGYEQLSLLAFTHLWNTRYNTQNRIVINASDEQLEARAMFCHSANSLLQYFNYFNRTALTERSVALLCDQMRHFINMNNNANNYNVNVQKLRNAFGQSSFNFSLQTFMSDILPSIRHCMESLNNISQLQGNIYLSLYESFWDVSFIIGFFNHIVNLLEANSFDVTPLQNVSNHILSAKANAANNKRRKKIRKLGAQDQKKSKKLLKRIKKLIHD